MDSRLSAARVARWLVLGLVASSLCPATRASLADDPVDYQPVRGKRPGIEIGYNGAARYEHG